MRAAERRIRDRRRSAYGILGLEGDVSSVPDRRHVLGSILDRFIEHRAADRDRYGLDAHPVRVSVRLGRPDSKGFVLHADG